MPIKFMKWLLIILPPKSSQAVIAPPPARAEAAPDGTFMTDQSVGVLEAGEADARSAWGLFCQFLLDGFAAGPPFRWAAAATLAPPMVLRG